jgi:hypothetical protein
MLPDDNDPKRAVDAVRMLTTYIYDGPAAGAQKRRDAETPANLKDKSQARLERIQSVSRPVTYTIDTVSGRLKLKE